MTDNISQWQSIKPSPQLNPTFKQEYQSPKTQSIRNSTIKLATKKQHLQIKKRLLIEKEHAISTTSLERNMNEIKQKQDLLLSKENKMLRFKITDFTSQPQIQNIAIKLWKLMVQLQYDLKDLSDQKPVQFSNNILAQQEYQKQTIEYSLVPLDVHLYEQTLLIFRKGLGILYDTDYYTAKKPDYLKDIVFFDRFCFDLISLLGDNLLHLDFSDVEYILRKIYQCTTHFVNMKQESPMKSLKSRSRHQKLLEEQSFQTAQPSQSFSTVKLLSLQSIHSPFGLESLRIDPQEIKTYEKEERKHFELLRKIGVQSESRNDKESIQDKIQTEYAQDNQNNTVQESKFKQKKDSLGLDIMGNIASGGNLLDLTKMLEKKRQLKEQKLKKIQELNEKERSARIYNPILIKENILNKSREIQVYKSKLSQERYFSGESIKESFTQLLHKNSINNNQSLNQSQEPKKPHILVEEIDQNQVSPSELEDQHISQRIIKTIKQEKKIEKIDLKTIELKKMDGLEDFSNPESSATNLLNIDLKRIEIMKKLNLIDLKNQENILKKKSDQYQFPPSTQNSFNLQNSNSQLNNTSQQKNKRLQNNFEKRKVSLNSLNSESLLSNISPLKANLFSSYLSPTQQIQQDNQVNLMTPPQLANSALPQIHNLQSQNDNSRSRHVPYLNTQSTNSSINYHIYNNNNKNTNVSTATHTVVSAQHLSNQMQGARRQQIYNNDRTNRNSKLSVIAQSPEDLLMRSDAFNQTQALNDSLPPIYSPKNQQDQSIWQDKLSGEDPQSSQRKYIGNQRFRHTIKGTVKSAVGKKEMSNNHQDSNENLIKSMKKNSSYRQGVISQRLENLLENSLIINSREGVDIPINVQKIKLKQKVDVETGVENLKSRLKNITESVQTSRRNLIQEKYIALNQMKQRESQSMRNSYNKKPTAFISVLPMEDFQLESWRQAYNSKEAANFHFNTGISTITQQKFQYKDYIS